VDGEALEKLVNRSGFLFQLAVEDHVRQGLSKHEWEVTAREYPWATADRGRSGFIDFVAERNNLRCVFECKRTQGGGWIFLVPDDSADTIALRTLWSAFGQSGARGWGWDDLNFHPRTLRSEFCVVHGASDDDKPMLERISADLVRASESLAREELAMQNRECGVFGYIPVIVTNTKLYACRVNPALVDLTSGTLPSSARFEEVSAIRFRKALPTDLPHPPDNYETIKKGLTLKERSAFVVQVTHLSEWLSSLKEASRQPASQYPWSRFLR
jgi:hypothetical protein